MRRLIVPLAALALTLGAATSSFAASDSWYAYRHDHRFRGKDARIEQGLRSGQLTPAEARTLEREAAQVDRMKMRARRDGFVSTREKARIQLAENRLDMRIWEFKHNRRNVRPD